MTRTGAATLTAAAALRVLRRCHTRWDTAELPLSNTTIALASRLTRPLVRLTETVEAVAAGDRDMRSHAADAPGELGALARAVDRMADTLQRQTSSAVRWPPTSPTSCAPRSRSRWAMRRAGRRGQRPRPRTARVDRGGDPAPGPAHRGPRRLAAAESAGLQLELEPFDLAEVVDDLLTLHAPRVAAAGLHLEVDLELPRSPGIRCCSARS